jgi:phosphoglycerate dehydrogenase-like enzyme
VIPSRNKLRIGLAHPVYQLAPALHALAPDLSAIPLSTKDALAAEIPNLDALVQASVLWSPDLLARATRLRHIQSISVGIEHFDLDALRQRGILLTNARGLIDRPVAEHAIGLMLMLTRHLAVARDRQRQKIWRHRVGDPLQREDELAGKTLLLVGFGAIGQRIATLARAFEMNVVAVRRTVSANTGAAHAVHEADALHGLLPSSDIIVLCCPLTPETERLIDARALAAMKSSAYLINVARGRIVDEPALIDALANRRIAGAGLDCFIDEPLLPSSPLWAMDNVVVTPHAAGETRWIEERLMSLLVRNLDRLWRGDAALENVII